MSEAEADEAFTRVSAISLEDGGSGEVADLLAEDPPISTFTDDGLAGDAVSSTELVRLPASRARRPLMPAISEPPGLWRP